MLYLRRKKNQQVINLAAIDKLHSVLQSNFVKK